MLTVQSTGDISITLLDRTFERENGIISVDRSQLFFRSTDPPSWIALIAELEWWQKVLGAGLTVYVSGMLAESGKDTWRHRAKIPSLLKKGGLSLARLAERIVTMQSLVPPQTRFIVGAPLADSHNTTALALSSRTAHEVESELALFCLHAAPLERALQEHAIDPIGQVTLTLTEKGNLAVRWMDRSALKLRELLLEKSE